MVQKRLRTNGSDHCSVYFFTQPRQFVVKCVDPNFVNIGYAFICTDKCTLLWRSD